MEKPISLFSIIKSSGKRLTQISSFFGDFMIKKEKKQIETYTKGVLQLGYQGKIIGSIAQW